MILHIATDHLDNSGLNDETAAPLYSERFASRFSNPCPSLDTISQS